MTYSRPGKGTHVVNSTGAAIAHGSSQALSGFVGVVIKQKAQRWSDGFVTPITIANGEKCWMITKGIVQVPFVAGFAKGDPVYIIPATGVLTETATNNFKFGKVIEVVGDGRSVPSGFVRIDLDAKDSF